MVMLGADRSALSELAKMTAASQAERTVLVRDLFYYIYQMLDKQTRGHYLNIPFRFNGLNACACNFADELVGKVHIHQCSQQTV